MVPSKLNNWAFDTVPQPGLNGRIGYQPRGKGLGGSSAINAMVYIRGHQRRLRPMGLARQRRLVVSPTCCPISSARKTMPISTASITARAARCMSTNCAPTIRSHDIFLQAAREAQFRDPRRLQRRGAGRPRHLSGDPAQRRTLERGARLYPSLHRQRGRICASRPRPMRRASCSRATARSASNIARATRSSEIRARREVILASGAFQTPQLLMLSGRRRQRRTRQAHGIASRAPSARRRPKSAGPSRFHLRVQSDSPNFTSTLAQGDRPAPERHRAVPPRAAAARMTIEFRRMRRLPEDPPGSRRPRHPAAFRHGHGRRPRPQAPWRQRLLLPRLPAAAEKPRQRVGSQSADPLRRAADRSEFPRRDGRSRERWSRATRPRSG